MKFWERTSGLYKKEIYYYDTKPDLKPRSLRAVSFS